MGNTMSLDGSAALVAALGDSVTSEQCRELSRQLQWSGDIDDFIRDAFDDGGRDTISSKSVLAKLQRELTKVAKDRADLHRQKEILKQKAENMYKNALAQPGVDGLSALPGNFRDAPVPRDTREVRPFVV